MTENAESQEELETEIVEEEESEQVESEETGSTQTGDLEETEEDGEVDIVLEGEEEPAPQKGKMPKRVKKLLDQRTQLQGELSSERQLKDLEIQQLRDQLAQQSVQQTQHAIPATMPLPPTESDPSIDYDSDKLAQAQVKYQGDLQTWMVNQHKTIADQNAHQTAQAGQVQAEKTAIEDHYDRASKLRVSDYDDNESSAVEILGRNTVKAIAMNMDNSAMIINYLGKNPAKAKEIAALDAADPRQGVAKLWELNFKLKAKPRKKSNAPEPETKIEGGVVSGTMQRRYDKAAEAGDIKTLRQVKKEAKAKGITLT